MTKDIKNGRDRSKREIAKILTDRFGFTIRAGNRSEGGGFVISRNGQTCNLKFTYSRSYHEDVICSGWHALATKEIEGNIFQFFIFVVEGNVNDLHYFIFKCEDIKNLFHYKSNTRLHFYFRVKNDGKAVEFREFEKDMSAFYNNWDRCFSTDIKSVKHFAAYHNVDKMGHFYGPSESFGIYSKKSLSFLETTIGEKVWVVNGVKQGSSKIYTLCTVYTPDQIIDSEGNFDYVICGSFGRVFNPPIVLNELPWFRQFLKNQTNFSLGINVILDEEAIAGLSQLAGRDLTKLDSLPKDVDVFDREASEGNLRFITHIRKERNKTLITAKKAKVLNEQGELRCEACGFNFYLFYGELGKGVCEVHHKVPLSAIEGNRITKLSDLAVLCSNCHRVIHRTIPMPSVSDFYDHIKNCRFNQEDAPVRKPPGDLPARCVMNQKRTP